MLCDKMYIKFIFLGGQSMKVILTVLGKDKVGIIARVCSFLSESDCNILDISQTIIQDYLNMIMIVDILDKNLTFEMFSDGIGKLAEEIGVSITVQNEEIFKSMHRI